MPRINEYSSQQEAQTPELSSNTNLEESGAVGRSIQNFGQVVTEAGDAAYKRAAQTETSDLNAGFAEARANLTNDMNEGVRNGTLTVQGAQQKYQDTINKLNKNIETYEGRNFFDREAGQLKGYVIKTAAHGQAQIAGEKAVSDYMSAFSTNADLLQQNPGAFNDVLNSSNEAIDAQVSTGAISSAVGDKLRQKTEEGLAKNTVRGMIRKNPAGAIQSLNKGEFDKYLDPDAKEQLYEHAKTEIRSRQDQFEKLLALKDKNPWEFLQKSGETSGVKPISLGPDAADSFTQRAEYIKEMDKKHGIDLPFLSEHEAEHITKQMMAQPPDQAIAAFNNIDTQVNDEKKSKFAMQIFKKEPALAASLMISGDSPDDSKKILAGMSLLRNGGEGTGKAVEAPPPAEIQSSFDSYVGNSVEDAGTRQAARQAIEAHMVKSLFDKGKTDFKGFTPNDFNESAKAVLGPAVDIGGKKTLSFRGKSGQFVEADRLNDLVDNLTDAKVQSIQGDVPRTMGGEPINLEKSHGRISLKSVGDGLYFVLRDSKPAWNKDKKPFVLNLKAIEKTKAAPQQPQDPLLNPASRDFAL